MSAIRPVAIIDEHGKDTGRTVWQPVEDQPETGSASQATEDYLAARGVAAARLDREIQEASNVYAAAVKTAVETYAAAIVDAGVKLNRKLRDGE